MPDIIKTIESWRRPRRVHQFLANTQIWRDPFPETPVALFEGDGRDVAAYGSMVRSDSGFYVFQLGRGKPKQEPKNLWFVYRGRVYGHFEIARIERNEGQFEELVTMYKREDLASEWHLGFGNYVAICKPPFEFFKGRKVFYSGFQGWRYFDLEQYRNSIDAKVRI